MRFYYCLLLILCYLLVPSNVYDEKKPKIFISSFNFEQAGYAQERCCNQGCVARVEPGNAKLVARTRSVYDVVEIYFQEDSFYLQQSEIEKIKTFIEKTKSDITLIGYTDGCGSVSYNKTLSDKRALSVKTNINKIDRLVDISVYAAGEISHDHDPKNRKVHMTSSDNVTLYEPPPKIIADVYLIDSSGSIPGTEFEQLRRSINYHRPYGSKVYISTTKCIQQMISFDKINTSGNTEIWYAYWYILDTMSEGQTLAIISDFDSSYPLQTWEKIAIEKKANDKKISVRLFSI